MYNSPIVQIRQSILFVSNLLQSFFCTTIQFKLKNIDIIITFYNNIGSSLAVLLFNQSCITRQQTENNIKSILKMSFKIFSTFVLIRFIRNRSKKSCKGISYAS